MGRYLLIGRAARVVGCGIALTLFGPLTSVLGFVDPTINTDKKKYSLGETFILTGAGFGAGKSITIAVLRPDHLTDYVPGVVSDAAGGFKASYATPNITGRYNITATDGTSSASVAATQADVFKADLQQCRNGAADSPNDCVELAGDVGWRSGGNAGSANSHYAEGQSIPYRMVITDTGATSANHTLMRVSISWDTVHSSRAAIDYITYADRITEAVNPCSGVTGLGECQLLPVTDGSAAPTTTSNGTTEFSEFNFDPSLGPPALACDNVTGNPNFVGADPSVPCDSWNSLNAFEPRAHRMVVAGGHVVNGSMLYQVQPARMSGSPALLVGQASTQIQFIVEATSNNVVVSWGGHIATRLSWGVDSAGVPNSAGGISGSPYHTSLIGICLDGTSQVTTACTTGGNQDTQLAAAAIAAPGTITIVKNTIGGNDTFAYTGTASTPLSGFSITTTGGPPGTGSQTFSSVPAGSYSVTESTPPSGWDFTSLSCTSSGTGTSTSISSQTASITLGSGGSVTCTYTNTKKAHLKLVKTVTNDNGGTAISTDWTLSASGATPLSGAGGAESDVTPGSYTLSESAGPTGYTAGSWSCSGGSQNGSSVTLTAGQSATCTIINNDNPPQLHLRKTVTNDNGGTAAATDWTLTATGASGSPTNLSGSTPVDSSTTTFKADTYTLGETGPSGYTGGAWDCGTATMPTATTVVVPLGGNVTCTINNNDNAPQLHLRKTVTNDNGGTQIATAWTLTATGANGTPTNLSGSTPVDSSTGFKADTYTLGETGPTGYTAGAWDCGGANMPTPTTVVVPLGGNVTCTINNNDTPPQLHLRKTVTNDNGGTQIATAWTLTATGAGGTPTNLSGSTPVDSPTGFKADTYTLGETGPSGYTAGSWDCGGATMPTSTTVVVPLGGNVTCTIINNDTPPQLHLRKTVTNDNGGTALATDWTLTATGTLGSPTNLSGSTPVDSSTTAFKADTYTLGEAGPGGYTMGAWNCGGATMPTATTVVVPLGGNVTCTVNNNDNAAHLKLVKTVTNNNGGTAMPTAWTLSASGPTPISGAGGAESDVSAGSYTLSETGGPSGYTAGNWSCVGGTQNGASVTLALGQSATCTINNDDQPAQLTLVKVVSNSHGGTATAANFALTAAGTSLIAVASGSSASVNAGSYALSETSLFGYAPASIPLVCVGGTLNGATITLGLGQSATCTFYNQDVGGTIIIKKNANPASGVFAFQTTGTGYNGFSLNGGPVTGQTNTQSGLNAGTYTAKELTQLGWTLTAIGGSGDSSNPNTCKVEGSGGSTGIGDAATTQTATIDLKNGDTVTCVFENTGNGVTRTQGFWATHPQLAQIAWFGGTAYGHTFPGVANTPGIDDALLCSRPIDTLGKLMGGFWSDIPKTSTNTRRSALDQSRMQLLQQLLAAELNASAFGTAPSAGSIAAWESAYCGTNTQALQTAQQQAGSFNTAGDSGTFTPGTAADSKTARAIANYVFWDILP